jgi:hypothetical protein
MLMLLAALLLPAHDGSAPAATDVAHMAALYEEACLKTFPIDTELDALMARKGATPLAADELRISLGADPGRGWTVSDGDQTFTVLLELPPYHACSVRASRPNSGKLDLAPYDAVVETFVASHRGFVSQPAKDADRGGIHMHAQVQHRPLPAGGGELLMAIDQQVTDVDKLAAGTTATPLRFVHQITTSN